MRVKTILEQLYNYSERWWPSIAETPVYQQALAASIQKERELCKALRDLNPPLERLFSAYTELHMETMKLEVEDGFYRGFRLGARLMLEIFEHSFDG